MKSGKLVRYVQSNQWKTMGLCAQRTSNIINNLDYCASIIPHTIHSTLPSENWASHLHSEFISMRKNPGVWGHAKKLG